VPSVADPLGPASSVLALVDGTDDHREAAVAGADLFASTPNLTVTVLAPSDVAQPSGAPEEAGGNNGALLKRRETTGRLMETVRAIEDRGLSTKLRTVDGSLAERAVDVAPAHDLVVLPPSRADEAEAFPVPTLVAP